MTGSDSASMHRAGSPAEDLHSSINLRSTGAHVKFLGLDGYVLGGVHFEATGDSEPSIAVILAAGGGIPARRYRHFASFLASSGIPALTFDYRGIGMSRPRSLRGFEAKAEDWSESDCGGAIAWMRARYPRAELTGIAHSIGSFIVGGAPNVGELSRFVFIAAHTGYYGDYAQHHRIPMALLWHVVMPALKHLFGYFPARLLGLGEDIPAGMALQWAARRTPDLRPEATDPEASRARAMLARYDEIKVPVFALSFADDAFATEAGARRLLAVYPGVASRFECVNPVSVGLSKVGHFGFFRQDANERLWPLVLAELRAAPTESPSTVFGG